MVKGKNMKLLMVVACGLSVTMLATGCSKKKVTDEGVKPAEIAQEQRAPERGTEERMPKGDDESLSSAPWGDEAGDVREGRTSGPMLPIYFDFDKYNVRDDQRGRIEDNATFLKGHAKGDIRIEGNCDERGTNEYNMALGERRAMSAKKYLANLGVDESRLTTLSYGEEKPLNMGHDELSWSQNRRDDFVMVK